MALLNKLQTNGSTLSSLNGTTPSFPNQGDSKLHKTYSINGIPDLSPFPQPSNLDLNGLVPENNYRDNSPEGASF
jgi:hypothetical protein